MQVLNFNFRFPQFFRPKEQTIKLSKNGFISGTAVWHDTELVIAHQGVDWYWLSFMPYPNGFWCLNEILVLNASVDIFQSSQTEEALEDEFHKEVIAGCLKECFPLPSARDLLEWPIEVVKELLPYLMQPIFFDHPSLPYLSFRADFKQHPELVEAWLMVLFRNFNPDDFKLHDACEKYMDYFPEDPKFQLTIRWLFAHIAEYKESLWELANSRKRDPITLRAKLLYYTFANAKLRVLHAVSSRIDIDPYNPYTSLDYILLISKADILLNYNKDFAAVAQLMKYLCFFGGVELVIYYQLIGCYMARQGFLYEAEQYKLKVLAGRDNFPLVYFQLGKIAALQEQYSMAVNYFNKAYELEKMLSLTVKKEQIDLNRIEMILLEYMIACYHGNYLARLEEVANLYQINFNLYKEVGGILDWEFRLNQLEKISPKESVGPILRKYCLE